MDHGVMTRSPVSVRSPVNIALIKYWGKADPIKVLPTTTSVSLTLTDLYSETTIEPATAFSFSLNGVSLTKQELQRIQKVVDYFPQEPIKITSINSFPTAAGLASSASGSAALTVALKHYFKLDLSFDELVRITRLGSGSAVRSLVDGFAVWHPAGHVEQLDNPFLDLRMIVCVVSDQKKAISSREAMKITQSTAPTYTDWVRASKDDYRSIRQAILNSDLSQVGVIMEKNSQRLHDIMKASQPSIVYQTTLSHDILAFVKTMRTEGRFAYATMDAGPNVKILTTQHDCDRLVKALKDVMNVSVIVSRIGGFADVV
jgi:diphosphomevalonate decarboxylase